MNMYIYIYIYTHRPRQDRPPAPGRSRSVVARAASRAAPTRAWGGGERNGHLPNSASDTPQDPL